MKYVEEVVLKEDAFCESDNSKLFKGEKVLKYFGPIKYLRGFYRNYDCLEKEAEKIKERIHAISEEDLPKSQ